MGLIPKMNRHMVKYSPAWWSRYLFNKWMRLTKDQRNEIRARRRVRRAGGAA